MAYPIENHQFGIANTMRQMLAYIHWDNDILAAVNHQCREVYILQGKAELSLVGTLKQASRCLRLGPKKDVPTPPTDVIAIRLRHAGIHESLDGCRVVCTATIDEWFGCLNGYGRRSAYEYKAFEPIGLAQSSH
jgi:hypothetical protein